MSSWKFLCGDADAEPLLGLTALESVGIEVDPLNQRLKRLPAVRLKRFISTTQNLSNYRSRMSLRVKAVSSVTSRYR